MSLHRLALIHPVDPRSAAPGVAARLERILARRPDDFSALLVGVDECGDLTPGRPVRLEADGRAYDFLPVMRARRHGWSLAAAERWSTRLAFRVAFLRHLSAIRDLGAGDLASSELHDTGWAPLARLLGHPIVQVLQNDCSATAHPIAGFDCWLALRLADRIVADPRTVEALRHRCADYAAKTEILHLPTPGLAAEPEVCTEQQIQRLYERHRRFFRVGRVAAAHPAVA